MIVHHFGYAFPLFRLYGMKNEHMMIATPLPRVLGVPLLSIFLLLMGGRAGAQADSLSRVLSQDAFLDIVRNHHPVARQANLIVDRAKADLISAKAGFDPLLQLTSERKTFDGKNYFDHFNPGLKIPTWYGVEVSAGVEDHLGDLLNPEVTPGRSSYLSFSVPLARNLLMDKRRAVLQQARIFREQSKSERLAGLNDSLHEATKDDWPWVETYLVHARTSLAHSGPSRAWCGRACREATGRRSIPRRPWRSCSHFGSRRLRHGSNTERRDSNCPITFGVPMTGHTRCL